MLRVTTILVMISVAIHPTLVETKLACQISQPDSGPAVSADHGLIPKVRVQATHCCGGRPFNSDLSLCCLGRVLRRTQKKCCLDGSNVPSATRCRCYTSPDWIVQQLEKLSELEFQLTGTLEELEVEINTLKQRLISKEELIAVLDGKASKLYQSLLVLLKIDANQSPGEVDDIIETIRFLNSNEESISSARKTANRLKEDEMNLLQGASDGTEESDGGTEKINVVGEDLRRLRREIRELESAASAGESVSEEAGEELNGRTSSSNIILRNIVLQRDKILNQISDENRLLGILRDRIITIERIKKIFESDQNLLFNIRGMLDLILDETIKVEAAKKEEEKEVDRRLKEARRKKRSIEEEDKSLSSLFAAPINPKVFRPGSKEEGEKEELASPLVHPSDNGGETPSRGFPGDETSSTTLPPPATIRTFSNRPCNFTAWSRYIDTFSRRRELVALDLASVLSPVANYSGDNLSRSTKVEQSFFARRFRVAQPSGNVAPERERRDTLSQQKFELRRVSLSERLEVSREFREKRFPWLQEMSKLDSKVNFRKDILPSYLKSKIN